MNETPESLPSGIHGLMVVGEALIDTGKATGNVGELRRVVRLEEVIECRFHIRASLQGLFSVVMAQFRQHT